MTFLCYKHKAGLGCKKKIPVFQEYTELKYKEGREVQRDVTETPSAQSYSCREGNDAKGWTAEATVHCETGG